MEGEAGGGLHLWRILLAAAAATRAGAGAETPSAAQSVFRAGDGQSIVAFGWHPRAPLLVDAHVHSAAQASAVAHVSQHPGPEVGEAAVF